MPTEEDPDKEVETSCKKLVPVFNELSFVNVYVPSQSVIFLPLCWCTVKPNLAFLAFEAKEENGLLRLKENSVKLHFL